MILKKDEETCEELFFFSFIVAEMISLAWVKPGTRVLLPVASGLSKSWRKTLGVAEGGRVSQALADFLLSHSYWAEEGGQWGPVHIFS